VAIGEGRRRDPADDIIGVGREILL
jgi:hypothetical protein